MAYTTINDPSAQFQALPYTGNSSTQSVTFDGNSNLQPDWVWTKCRSNTSDNFVFDSTRGVHKRIFTNTTAAEVTNTNALTSFDSDGFSMGNVGGMNFSSQTYVGWGWKATGGTTSSNTDGSITSTVQANTTAGFSIVKWTGTGSAATIGHGLGVAPQMVIVKNLDKSSQWGVYNESVGATKYVALSDSDAEATYSGYWNDTAPTTSVFSVGSDGDVCGGNGEDVIAYCFASIQGYSKIGKYTGNGNADGPFIYTGFKPAWLMVKRINSAGTWLIWNNASDTYNTTSQALKANTTNAQTTGYWNIDFLSNGFKIKATDAELNGNGDTIIYMAFADQSLVGTNNVIGLAR